MTDTVWDAKIRISLRKSKIRRTVLEYLVSVYPKKAYVAEVARETDLRPTDVCGVLNGLSDRFKKENSLVDLGLVKKHEEKDTCLYSATEVGCEILRLLNR